MWPFQSCTLFPPPTEAWLQMVSSDPEAQGWGAWARPEKNSLEPGSGAGREAEEDDDGDASFLLSLLESERLAKGPEPDQELQELEAIKLKLWTMEQAQAAPEPPSTQTVAKEEEAARARQLLSPETVAMPMWSSPPGAQPWPLHSWMRASFGAGSSRCSPRGPTSQASAPQTAGASGGTWAPGQHPSYAAASRAGPGSDHVGRAGAVEDSPRGSRHTEATSDSTWGQGWGRSQQLCALGPLIPDRPGLQP
ncbi:embryonic polyadenylate-binding protein 2 isoform X4 [Fukomys damarensis]|uniref:embryonic polyadenylate-binding protein 2 isoform X4 n=1 Tax=Fukomys damarensis TaxID=885580 RepID=UPI00053FD3C4|nr:embryonic polyadenylate-binding protein 2 isoform X4 [Fukomys damarensis]